MFSNVRLDNFLLFDALEWEGLGPLNVVVGENDTGKSCLLEVMYAVSRSFQETAAQEVAEASWEDVLSKKLRWTFQPANLNLSRLIRRGASEAHVELSRRWQPGSTPISVTIGKEAQQHVTGADYGNTPPPPFGTTASFFPPKEVFTQARAISETRDRLGIIGFGDTYYDLVKDLRSPHTFLDLEDELKPVLRALDNLYRGTIIQPNGEFVLRRDEGDFEMSVVAEGIKKVGALVELIRSRRIQLGTSLFFDEIEANLHPQLLYDVLDQLVQFVVAANESSQVFIATHSYFVLKSLELLAREHEIHVPICVLRRTADGRVEPEFSSLEEGMPKNSIVDASVELFNRNLELQARGA